MALMPFGIHNKNDYFTVNWWQDENKLKQAEQALCTEITKKRKLSLYDIKDSNKLATIQRIVNAKRTQLWDEGTLNAIEDGLVAMGVDSTNAIELDKIWRLHGEDRPKRFSRRHDLWDCNSSYRYGECRKFSC
ncbi:hypothetical protein [Paenibacillus polymyxa]|uniref:hypothetical protein n=1 Tax=Paenibacillus polymyxa TaxID=1406 RepID=UPI00296F9674|nr:hypothetical protein [Paenibacillus polymyxa]WOZ37201.1 hypothetical protein RQP19_17770 [Paenibacillus polymyxa]